METRALSKHTSSYKTQGLVWCGLIVLTATTVTVAKMELGRLSTMVALLIASVKASLVLYFFMHLKYERRLFKVMFFVPVLTLLVILLLTFSDIWFR